MYTLGQTDVATYIFRSAAMWRIKLLSCIIIFMKFKNTVCITGYFVDKTALVFSGGGAKGAYESGVLESICNTPIYRNSWEMLTGTSIGALTAGGLAQFDKDQQCTTGLRVVQDYWNGINSADDMYRLGNGIGISSCLSVINGPALLNSFFRNGGFCDPSVGRSSYRRAVNGTRIQQSNMKLWVPTASLTKRSIQWWNDQSPHIMDALLGSAAISPLVYPIKFADQWHVDGMLYTNTPLLKALEEGCQRALVIMLQPLVRYSDEAAQSYGPSVTESSIDATEILSFYWQIIEDDVFVYKELNMACRNFPQAEILGWFPDESLGDVLDYSREHLQDLVDVGRRDGSRPPVDLCAVLGIQRDSQRASVEVIVAAAVFFGFALGSIIPIISAACRSFMASKRALQALEFGAVSHNPPPSQRPLIGRGGQPGQGDDSLKKLLEEVANNHGLTLVKMPKKGKWLHR